MKIEYIDHVGIRVYDEHRSLSFYQKLGFFEHERAHNDPVVIIKNKQGVEINLIVNAKEEDPPSNILMDIPVKHSGITHIALQVPSIIDAMNTLSSYQIPLSGGPAKMGEGSVSIFIRDPDRNVIEIRGREQEEQSIPNLQVYTG
ncbi:MAG: glyoxalase [Deltaproteobacteria bacterium]|nr:glyoxalase [Deltaproteobacteria bacterium]